MTNDEPSASWVSVMVVTDSGSLAVTVTDALIVELPTVAVMVVLPSATALIWATARPDPSVVTGPVTVAMLVSADENVTVCPRLVRSQR